MRQKRPRAVGVSAGAPRRKGGPGALPAATSLPPLVEGPLRCFLRCSVSRVLWSGPRPPGAVLVRLRWWGETHGTVFQPAGTAQPAGTGHAAGTGHPAGTGTVRYPVRCGPRQLAAYLRDMGVLILEVMTKLDHLPVGRVQITGLSQLSPSNPIHGFFPIVSPTSDKLGELQVSLVLEPLPGLCNSSSSVPATEGSLGVSAAPEGSQPQFLATSQHSRQARVTGPDHESDGDSRATAPSRGKDHLLFQGNSENRKDTISASDPCGALPDEHLKVDPSDQQVSPATSSSPEAAASTSLRVLSLHNPATRDLLSALLEQGNKLRDAMVVSAMKSTPDMEIELNKVPPFAERDCFKAQPKSPKGLNSDFVPTPEDPHLFASEVSGHHVDLNPEERAIQLLLGSIGVSPVQCWDRMGSLLESLSLGSEVCDSEANDPHYDQSLLDSLFYSAPKSDSSLSDLLSDDDDDVKSTKKVTRAEVLKKTDPGIPQKDSDAMDQGQKVAEIKPSPLSPPEGQTEAHLTSLSAGSLALLQQRHLARVIIDTLKIPPASSRMAPRQKGSVGKPPPPAAGKKCTFFVECHFPVGACKGEKGQVSLTTEVIRIASSKITDDVVKFQQRFVFPVCFGAAMIEHWWSSDLAFKIYMRERTQKKPVAMGSAALQLRRVLQSELLSLSCQLPVEKEGGQAQAGPLKVSLELTAERGAFPGAPAPALRRPRVECQLPSRSVRAESPVGLHHTGAPSTGTVHPAQAVPPSAAQMAPEEVQLLLHVLLMVPDGKDFVTEGSGLPSSHGVYLNCKLLSTEEATRSAVVWGTAQPAFHFFQVMPFSLTPTRLEQLKNNVMVIEVWNQVGSPGCDRLLGLVKLPLHQFYISFKSHCLGHCQLAQLTDKQLLGSKRDPKISHLLLQAQYPVVAVDSYMPVVDVFSGSRSGSLRVVLAMGSADQIVALQRLKTEAGVVPPSTQRPSHSLDPPPSQPTVVLLSKSHSCSQSCLQFPEHSSSPRGCPLVYQQGDSEGEDLMEHVFEIHVQSVKGLTPLQTTVWGEADCYIQYYFPVQEAARAAPETQLHQAGVELKPFRTATALCVPDPIFNHQQQHSLLLPAAVPVQRLLLSAFMAPAAGGIPFEVWCRYYYPNVRDQMVAKGTLPLSGLCAMVTMKQREERGMQTFNLPLVPRADSSEEFHLRSSGLLDVSVRYQGSMRTAAGVTAQAVSLCVQIHRAAGLQAAARAVAQRNPAVQYYAGVGVNAYVSVHLSFLPKAERHSTAAVPSTFCPEFQQHVEFPCKLIIQKSSGEVSSLGELLQSASIIFSVYHQSTRSAPLTSRDCLLGTTTIPTRDLLRRRSGISGWYPVVLPEDALPLHFTSVMQATVGGLEVSVAFAGQGDRERVLEAAEFLGWGSADSMDESGAWEQISTRAAVTISTPRVWLPVHCLLPAGHTHLDKSTFCYLRYKLHDQEPVWTSLERPRGSGDTKTLTVSFRKPNQVTVRRSPELLWFLREERLEIQVWRAYGKENGMERPLGTDQLLGSAYVDLAALAESSRTTPSVSGVYPLFRCNAADLAGAALRVHIVLASKPAALPSSLHRAEEDSSSEDEDSEKTPELSQPVCENQSQKLKSGSSESTGRPPEELLFLENTVAVSILVERAMHLSLKGSPLTEREVAAPSSCVSFAVAGRDAPITTSVVENTDSPVWDFQQEARLSKELLLDPQQTLVFKVWHRAESERVMGFASVDLSPLLSGFQLVCGWYNITDFSGQCRGQLKVAVSPLQSVKHLREERQARIRALPAASSVKGSFPAFPSNAPFFAKQMLNTLSKEVPARELPVPGGAHGCAAQMPCPQEHMQNIHGFQQSLQQAHQALRVDSLSSPVSLLTALRKNLRELDEVQRYFSQKLARSFPDFSHGTTCRASCEEQESGNPGLMSRELDPRECHPLGKSHQLVSQASSLIHDLQTVTKTSRDCSPVHQDSSRKGGAARVPGQEDEPARPEAWHRQLEPEPGTAAPQQPSSAGTPQFRTDMVHQLLAHAVPAELHPWPADCIPEDEAAFADQPQSEEEYEEDVIEARALNEITTITDNTSPWSSVLSEEEQGAAQQPPEQCPVDVGCLPRGSSRQSSTFSSLLQGDSQSTLSSPAACGSPCADKRGPLAAAEGFQSLDSGTETTQKGLFQPDHLSEVHQPSSGSAEDGTSDCRRALSTEPAEQSVELQAASREQLEFPPDVGLASARAAEGEEEAAGGVVGEDWQNEHRHQSSSDTRVSSVPAQAASQANSESSPSDSHGDPLEESVDLEMVLSDPVVLPNFFLPLQQMEASMRLLSIPQPSSPVKGSSTAVPRGIPHQRPRRPQPTAELSEEETRRISRIFSEQLLKKE